MGQSRIEALKSALPWPWYFFGAAGRGKSYAAALVYAYWPIQYNSWMAGSERMTQPRRPGSMFYPASKLIGDLVSARINGGAATIFKTIRESDLVVLDDAIDRGGNDMRRAALLDILNERGKKPLIVTGNFTPSQLMSASGPLQDDRIASRLCSGTIFEFQGKDQRMIDTKIIRV